MTSLNQSLIRTNFKRSYNFQRHTKDDKILVTNNLSFSVRNPLSEAVPYFAKMEFEEGQTPAKIGVSVALNGKEHLRHNRFQPSATRPRIVEMVSTEVSLKPGEQCDVLWVFDSLADKTGSDSISFGFASDGAIVSASIWPDIYRIVAEGIPPAEITAIDEHLHTWTFARRIEAGHQITVRWWPRATESTPSPRHGHACRRCSARYECGEDGCANSRYRLCESCWSDVAENDYYRILGITERPLSDD